MYQGGYEAGNTCMGVDDDNNNDNGDNDVLW